MCLLLELVLLVEHELIEELLNRWGGVSRSEADHRQRQGECSWLKGHWFTKKRERDVKGEITKKNCSVKICCIVQWPIRE